MKFANLHNHTDLGSFDSILTPGKFVDRLLALGQEHLVQTDHGTLRGMVAVSKAAQKAGLKYIPGLEVYATFGKPQKAKDEFGRLYYHMLLIAKNNTGLKNLQKLIALSYQPHNMYYKPRLGLEDIFKYSEGLIATSGCLASLTSCTIMAEADGHETMTCSQCHILGHPCDDHEVPEDLILDPTLRGARSLDGLIDKFTKHFKEDYYLELQDSGAGDAQDLVNRVLIDAGQRKGIPLIVTSDAHYALPEESKLRSMVLRIRHGKSAEEASDEAFYQEGRIYLKTGEELAKIFGDEPVKNTVHLVDTCSADIDFKTTYFPVPDLDGDLDEAELKVFFRKLAIKGLFELGFDSEEYKSRLKMEMDTICSLGFAAYFLVLKEILDWAKDQGILIGPGRGCLTKDARVLKDKMLSCSLDQIKIGDSVLSHTGRVQKVINTFKYPVSEELIKLEFYYGDSRGITLTKDHVVFAEHSRKTEKWIKWPDSRSKLKKYEVPSGNWTEIQAKELKIGDWIYHPKPKRNLSLGLKQDLSDYAKTNSFRTIVSGEYLEESVLTNHSFEGSIRDIHNNTKVPRPFISKLLKGKLDCRLVKQSKNLTHKRYLTSLLQYLDTLNYTVDSWKKDYAVLSRTTYKIKKTIPLDAEFMWILGKWVADGWLATKKKRMWGICFHSSETDQILKVKRWLCDCGLSFKVYPHLKKKLIQIEANSETLVNYFKSIFPDYKHTSCTKTIPNFLYKADDNLLLEFLKGYFDGDGHFETGRIKATTVSQCLAEQIKQCLLYLNIPSSIRTENRIDPREEFRNTKTSYVVSCPTVGCLTKYYPAVKSRYRYKIFKHGFMTQLKSIKPVENVKFVYDIEIDNDNSYVTTNGTVHNSACGSLVSYALGITNIDPIKYGLYFSRFLNKDRVSLPDVDVDLPKDRREEVIRYVVEKYGSDKVCQILTFSSMKPKGMARDIARTLGLESLGNEIAELIPPPLHGKDPTLSDAIEQEPKLKDKKFEVIVSQMKVLEGLTRTTGVHAAGIIISPIPLTELCPVEFQGKEKDKPVAQLSMNELEDIGLVKMDFLGLRNLEIISNCIDFVDGLDSAMDIPDDDPATYKNLRTTREFGGIFQFEGSVAIGDLLRKIKPTCLRDIADATSLFRPGALSAGMDKKYLKAKNTNWRPESKMDELLKDTYGCLIYQEDLMRICVEVAGFSESDSDSVRKAIGKKNIELMMTYKDQFIDGCITKSNMKPPAARELWQVLEYNGDYGFNLSHGISYSLISYWCAYLRTHYLSAFMAAALNASFDNKDKLIGGLKTCKNLNVTVLPPQILSLTEMCSPVDDNTIQLGLSVCKYLKKGSKEAVKASKYKPDTLMDFFTVVNRTKFNSGKAVALAKAGILDSLAAKENLTRTGLIEAIPPMYEHFKLVGRKIEQRKKWVDRKERRLEQEFLKAQGKDYGGRFVGIGKEPEEPSSFDFKTYSVIEDNLLEVALGEYEILGLCLGLFPTDFMNKTSKAMSIHEAYLYAENQLAIIGGFKWSQQVTLNLAGITTQFKEQLTRKKKMRASFLLEDHSGIVECNIFTKAYERLRHKLEDRTCIECECTVLGAEDGVLEVAVNNYRILKPLENIKSPKRLQSNRLDASTHIEFVELVDLHQSKTIQFKNISYIGTP